MSDNNEQKKWKSVEISESGGDDLDTITDAANHLHNLLKLKEKELKEKEADFGRRVNLYESEHPSIGKDNDVLQLNVGGDNISVRRSTLTQFPDTVLAAQFSGRWDDSMEKDRDGNIFIDQDPEYFKRLVSYLRLRLNNKSLVNNQRQIPEIHLPKPTYKFCQMVDYYGLMPGIYPQRWIGNRELFSCEEISYGTFVLSNDATSEVTVLYNLGLFAIAGVNEFSVEFAMGTTGAVGWMQCPDNGNKSACTHNMASKADNSIFLNVSERKIFGQNGVLRDNMSLDHTSSNIKIICSHDGYDGVDKYSVEVVDAKGNTCGNTCTLTKSISNSTSTSMKSRIFPVIRFNGKVTVSKLMYAIGDLEK